MHSVSTIASRIKLARTERKLSQKEFANALEVSEGYLSHVETGKNIPSVPMLLKICHVLKTSPNDLLLEDYCLNENVSYSHFYRHISNLTPDERFLIFQMILHIEKNHINQGYYQRKSIT